MKILITPDVPGWAIGNLTDSIIRHNPRFYFINIPVHPRAVGEALPALTQVLNEGVDFWHAQYWNSAVQLMKMLPKLKEIPKLLTHHNHDRLNKQNWSDFKGLNEMTEWGCNVLKKNHNNVFHIPHGVDLDRFSYLKDYPPKEPAVGYVGRVVPWKNLDKICTAAKKLGYKVVGSGYVDKPDYFKTIDQSNLEFYGGMGRTAMAPANVKDDLYVKMTVFVMYSTDEKESGTLPLLEAMARGVPVMCTRQGMARDLIKDGKNGVFFEPDEFESKLKDLMGNEKKRIELRKNAWNTIRQHPEERMAREYAKAYYKIMYGDNKLISVIIPTFNRPNEVWEAIKSIDKQEYPAKEIIIINDGGKTQELNKYVIECKRHIKTPVLLLNTNNQPEYYGLAQARNMGAIEALGEILLFMDDRYTLEPNALSNIANNSDVNKFYFGQKIIKGKLSTKTAFMENFSWINKKEFFKAGMFCERLNIYGGMSEEVRTRFSKQGYELVQIKDAKCKEIKSSIGNKGNKDKIWKAKYLLYKMYE